MDEPLSDGPPLAGTPLGIYALIGRTGSRFAP